MEQILFTATQKNPEVFNNYIMQQFTVDDNDMILPPLADRDYPDIKDLIITSHQVKNILSTLLQRINWM